MKLKKRVVITGAGVKCSVAQSVRQFDEAIRKGYSGEANIPQQRFDTSHRVYRNRNAYVLEQSYYERLKKEDPVLLYAFCCDIIEEALQNASLCLDGTEDPYRIGIAAGTSVGSNFALMDWANTFRENPETPLSFNTPPTIVGSLKRKYNICGPSTTISTACAAGTNAIGRAYDFIQSGKCDTVIAGGVDIFTEHSYSGFNILGAISKSGCKPFSAERDGMMLGDGGAFFVVEDLTRAQARGATILCEIKGYATLNEAYHPTSPKPDGSMATRVMKEAIAYAGLQVDDIDCINVHATATPANDAMEWRAIEKLFNKPRDIYITALKSMTGHTLGAAGSIELLASVLGLAGGYIPPAIHTTDTLYNVTEANKHLILVKEKPLFKDHNYVLSNSFGFAGNMASIVIAKYRK